jgi:SAM-dependent methyltransferase
MNEAPAIKDYTEYNRRMDLSVVDKLFFVDKIHTDMVVDFGCGPATLLKNLKLLVPDMRVIGYDNDPNMIKHSEGTVSITNEWELVKSFLKSYGGKAVKHPSLILSSVIHEIFHYCGRAEIDDFWDKVFNSGFEYIVIRDMVPSRTIDHPSCINDVKKIYRKFLGSKALTDFERIWGSIENNRQLVHFLLKYKYLEPNWEREVKENYIPVAREDLLAKIPDEYDIIFHEHYVLPYLLQTVKDDTGIEIKDPTHLKLILKKRK